jgi:hypothetical protein
MLLCLVPRHDKGDGPFEHNALPTEEQIPVIEVRSFVKQRNEALSFLRNEAFVILRNEGRLASS